MWLPKSGVWAQREGELNEGGQKEQTSSYKINKYWGCNVQHNRYNEHCCTLYMKVVERVNPKSSHHKEKNVFSFSFILYLYEMMEVH